MRGCLRPLPLSSSKPTFGPECPIFLEPGIVAHNCSSIIVRSSLISDSVRVARAEANEPEEDADPGDDPDADPEADPSDAADVDEAEVEGQDAEESDEEKDTPAYEPFRVDVEIVVEKDKPEGSQRLVEQIQLVRRFQVLRCVDCLGK